MAFIPIKFGKYGTTKKGTGATQQSQNTSTTGTVTPDRDSPEYRYVSNETTPADLQPDPATLDTDSPEYRYVSNETTPADLQPDPATPAFDISGTPHGGSSGTSGLPWVIPDTKFEPEPDPNAAVADTTPAKFDPINISGFTGGWNLGGTGGAPDESFDRDSPEYRYVSNETTPADLQPDPGTPTVTWTDPSDPVPPEDLGTPEIIDPATPAAPTQYDQMFQDIMAKHDAGWQNQEDLARAEAASQQRRAAEISAGMGAAVGGGTFASGMAQAGLKGRETMMQARKEHELRGLELQMTNLQNQLKIAEAQKDRDQQTYIQNLINNTALAIEEVRFGAYPEISSGGGGSESGGITDMTAEEFHEEGPFSSLENLDEYNRKLREGDW